jgi:hypothetical protein
LDGTRRIRLAMASESKGGEECHHNLYLYLIIKAKTFPWYGPFGPLVRRGCRACFVHRFLPLIDRSCRPS